MDFFKTWIIPPVMGAIIGYFTNWLAIKMLFRPLKPVYIGKFKLPFTPGILPMERERLTRSVGETVSKELLTPDVFKARLSEPALKAKVEKSVRDIVDRILDSDAAALAKNFTSNGAANGTAGDVAAGDVAAGDGAAPQSGRFADTEAGAIVAASLSALFSSAEFSQALAEAAGRAAESAVGIPLVELVPPERLRVLAEKTAQEWSGEDRRGLVEAFLDKAFGTPQDSGALLSAATISPVVEIAARSLYGSLLPVVERILASDAVKADLSSVGRDMVRRAIGRLGPIQRLIVSAANYEKTLGDSMPDTIADISKSLMDLLRSDDMEGKVVEAALAYVATPRIANAAFPVTGILPLPEMKRAAGLFLRGLGAEKSDFAARVERRYRRIAGKSLGELLPGVAEVLSSGIADCFSDRPDAGKKPSARVLGSAAGDFFRSYSARIGGKTLGDLLGLGPEKRARLAGLAADGVSGALASQADRLVEALDVQSMVVDKLNELDMLDVERIILQVVNEELNWITILGGILGGIIGIFQSLLSLI